MSVIKFTIYFILTRKRKQVIIYVRLKFKLKENNYKKITIP